LLIDYDLVTFRVLEVSGTRITVNYEAGSPLSGIARQQAYKKAKKDDNKRQQHGRQRQEWRKLTAESENRADGERAIDYGYIGLEVGHSNLIGI
jgi:hypothetical protein